jgi:hypothetical protein
MGGCEDIHTSRYNASACTRQHAQCQDSTMTPTRYLGEIRAYLLLRGHPPATSLLAPEGAPRPLLAYLLLRGGDPVRCSSTYPVERGSRAPEGKGGYAYARHAHLLGRLLRGRRVRTLIAASHSGRPTHPVRFEQAYVCTYATNTNQCSEI